MFTLTIDTGNDAFFLDTGAELARILRETADRLENGDTGAPVYDYNGNTVGRFELHQDSRPTRARESVCPNWEPAIWCDCDYCTNHRAQ